MSTDPSGSVVRRTLGLPAWHSATVAVTGVWYVAPDGTAIVWGDAVVDGLASGPIYRRLKRDEVPWPQDYLWRPAGAAVSDAQIASAVAETSADPVPDPYEPPPSEGEGGSYDPAGTAAAAVAAIPSDSSAGTASLRTLGTTSAKAAAGDHTHPTSLAGPRFAAARVTSGAAGGDTPTNSSGSWTRFTGVGTLAIAAAVGDYVELAIALLTNRSDTGLLLDIGIYAGGTPVWYASSGTGTPAAEGDPGLYPTLSPRGWYAGVVAQGGHLSGGTLTWGLAYKGNGTGKIYYSTDYPFRWRTLNYGPPTS